MTRDEIEAELATIRKDFEKLTRRAEILEKAAAALGTGMVPQVDLSSGFSDRERSIARMADELQHKQPDLPRVKAVVMAESALAGAPPLAPANRLDALREEERGRVILERRKQEEREQRARESKIEERADLLMKRNPSLSRHRAIADAAEELQRRG